MLFWLLVTISGCNVPDAPPQKTTNTPAADPDITSTSHSVADATQRARAHIDAAQARLKAHGERIETQ
jgi:hypothetical protein